MLTAEDIQLLKTHVSHAENILILFPTQAKFDQVATALALFLGLQEAGKNVTVLSPVPVTVGLSSLVGIDKVTNQLGNKNLQITFDFQEDAVDKVSYNIEEDEQKFHLVIQPKKGAKPLSSKSVSFSYVGVEADLIFLIGVHSLDELDQLYLGQEELYADATTVSINTYETTFGSLKLSTAGSASFSEVGAYILQELDLPISADMATNLLGGISSATNNFQSLGTTADTFEISAKLLRLGARRMMSEGNNFMQAFSSVSKKNGQPKETKASETDKSSATSVNTTSVPLLATGNGNKRTKTKSLTTAPSPSMEGGSRL